MVSTSARKAGDSWFNSRSGTTDFVRQILFVYIHIFFFHFFI